MEGDGKARLLGVRLLVAELASGIRAYECLLGRAALHTPEGAHLVLDVGVVEIAAGGPAAAGLLLVSDAVLPTDDFAGLRVDRVAPPRPAPRRAASSGAVAIDHVVVATHHPDRAIALWRGRLGFRLALDRPFPDRGLRMIFLRSGGMTLEVTAPLAAEEGDVADAIFGIAYRVGDLEACRRRLVAAGVDVSEVRRGRKPGTEVFSVRSDTENVPTLLIRDPSRDESDRRSAAAAY